MIFPKTIDHLPLVKTKIRQKFSNIVMIEEKLESLGVKLPNPPTPAGSYVPAVKTGNLLFISGQIPMEEGKVLFTGKVTDDNLETAQKSARMCAINLLAQIKRELGSLDKVTKIVRLSGFVNSDAEFYQHPKVINPASDLFFEVFGDKGKHSRIAVGVACLPLNSMTEIDAIVEFSD
jgi:enamine deaminase RidA (YjgF/YER057c/UK114 family)